MALGHKASSCTIWCAIGPYQKHWYNFNKATNDFKTKYMKENDIEEEFAEGVVVNPLYSLQGEVVDNPTYLVNTEL